MSSVGLLIARDSQNFDDVKSAYSTLLVHKQSVVIETTGKGPSPHSHIALLSMASLMKIDRHEPAATPLC